MSRAENLAWLAHLPEGWAGLYEKLVAEIGEVDPTLRVTQAKQKFGSLRVYLAKGPEKAYDLIDAASRQSASTCERCGGNGRLYNSDGYYQTVCKEHAEPGAMVAKSNPVLASFRIADGISKRVD